jgi:hypothetical protein
MSARRLPFLKHLKWLLLEGLTPERIGEFYDSIQMPKPNREHIHQAEDSLRGLIMPPATRRRLSRLLFDEGDQKLWAKYGYEEIYLHRMGKSDWGQMGRMLNHPVMRVALECCLVARVPHEDLSQLLPSVYALPLETTTIELYQKYFWDYEGMDRNDWQAYLELVQEDRYTHSRLFIALTRPQEQVLHAVGLPSRMQFGTMLKNIMNTANYRFEHYARQQSPDAQEEARKWAKVLIEAGTKHEKFGATDATDFSKLIQTQFEHLDPEIPNVTPEMLADAKPALQQGQTQSVEEKVSPPPDTSFNPGGNDNI